MVSKYNGTKESVLPPCMTPYLVFPRERLSNLEAIILAYTTRIW